MYMQNRDNSSKFKGYSSLQFLKGLIDLNYSSSYFVYPTTVVYNAIDSKQNY